MAVTTSRFNPLMFGGTEIPEVGSSLPLEPWPQLSPAVSPWPKPSDPPAPGSVRAAVRDPPRWNKYYQQPGSAIPMDLVVHSKSAEELGPRAVNLVREVTRLPLSEKYEHTYVDGNGDVWVFSWPTQKFILRYNTSEARHRREFQFQIDQPPHELPRHLQAQAEPVVRRRINNPPNRPDPEEPRMRSLKPPPQVRAHPHYMG